MRARIGCFLIGLAATSLACGGISDCKEDGAKCAEMLNANAAKCAQAYQLRQSEKNRKYCVNAVDVVGDQKIAAAIPGLKAILAVPDSDVPDDKHREEAVKSLAQIGDASVVPDLIAAIDLSAGTSSDPKDKAANLTNEAIAQALGELKAAAGVPKLIELTNKSPNNYVVLKAVRALGQIGDKSAVKPLEKIALEHSNKFMRKNAVVALGDIGDPSAVDTLIQMMFVEYQGVSFYKEASFGLYQIGPAASEALMKTMAGENKAVNEYFETTGGLKTSAIKAKCGFVLGDLRDPRAVDPLLEAFNEAAKKPDPVVLVYAAAPLGALGDSKAAKPLAQEMMTLDASLRDPIMRALNNLGDRSVVPAMIEAMTKEHFVKECMKAGNSKDDCTSDQTKASLYGAQKAAIDHASNLAGAEHVEAYKKVVEAETDKDMKEYMEARMKRLDAAAECKLDAGCWVKKLEDSDKLVREKAAWELGRIKDKGSLDALAKALKDKKPEPRSAAIMAYWAFGDKRAVEAIEKQLEDESGMADYVRVNEDLKRLLVHLKRS